MISRIAKALPLSRKPSPWTALLALAAIQACVYAALSAISFQFGPDSKPTERPIPAMFALLGLAFACYWAALSVVRQIRESRRLLAVIVVSSVLFRAISLFSWPILEIDIYRYIWDGTVTMQGVSPYRFSPDQVLTSDVPSGRSPELDRLRRLHGDDPALHTILSRVHYGELPTIYPPVSQAVFALAVLLTPAQSGVFGRILIMKTILVLFDTAALGAVLALLRRTGSPINWAIAYGWCPLVIKEIANTGHLDAVAVFLTTSAVYFAIRPLGQQLSIPRSGCYVLISAFVAALAVGAKLYPVVLTPLFVAVWARSFGAKWAAAGTLGFLLTTALVLWPMAPWEDVLPKTPLHSEASGDAADDSLPPPPTDTAKADRNRTTGLAAFLHHWEMNDFCFMLIVENLKPHKDLPANRRPWFSIVPEPWKEHYAAFAKRSLGLSADNSAFVTARFVTGMAFLGIAAGLIWQVRHSEIPAEWLRAAFLIIAWFWLLSPTQNPWYWTWAMPLVMFARSRVWWAVAGIVMAYYLRFWLSFHWPNQRVLSTPYSGAAFFDFVVTWLEYGPWFVWTAWEALRKRAPAHDVYGDKP